MAPGSPPSLAMTTPPSNTSRRVAASALFIGQLAMASSAAAMCQNASCRLPADWVLSSPLDFTAGPGSLLAQPGSLLTPGEENSSEIFISTSANRTKRADTADEDGYSLRSVAVQLGSWREIAPDTLLVWSFVYDDSRQRSNDRLARTNSQLYYADLAMERQWNGWRASGMIGYAHGRHRMRRVLTHEPQAAVGHARTGSHHAVLGAGLSYRFEGPDWYLEPKLGLALLYEHTPAYREDGLGPENQNVRRGESLKTIVAPALEFGKHVPLGRSQLFYWASLGVSFLPDNTWKAHGHLSGEPNVRLTEVTTLPSVMGDFQAGLVLSRDSNWSLHAQYGLQAASNYRSHSATLRLAWAF